MNGNRTAEQIAEAASRSAQLASVKAKEAASSAVECFQSMGRTERESRETRAVVIQVQRDMREGFIALHALIEGKPKAKAHEPFIMDDFEDSPTGSHYIVNKHVADIKLRSDARAWRTMWRKVRSVVWLALGGAATFGGEQLLKYLLGHH